MAAGVPPYIADAQTFSNILRSFTFPRLETDSTSMSARRGMSLKIPKYSDLSLSNRGAGREGLFEHKDLEDSVDNFEPAELVRQDSRVSLSVLAPPTPPEDGVSFQWQTRQDEQNDSPLPGNETVSDPIDGPGSFVHEQSIASSTNRAGGLNIIRSNDAVATSNAGDLSSTIRILTASLPDTSLSHNIEMVSQVLPSQALDQRSCPMYERVFEQLSQERSSSFYMTITHAATQSKISTEVPRSPPVTPGIHHSADEYFSDQMVFTNVSMIPVYHDFNLNATSQTNVLLKHVVAPTKANISLLERYIPPSSGQEYNDFFDITSRKSYLVDRLQELSNNNGTLLLIYPTKSGAQSFARHYLAPVLDPLLRQMTVLKGLSSRAAECLGIMESIDDMLDFAALARRVEDTCNQLTIEQNQKRPRGTYRVVHASTANVVLEADTWTDWFIGQEQQRIKQEVVDFYKEAGTNLAMRDAHYIRDDLIKQREETASMLARDIIEGVRQNKSAARVKNIEVGVFVIQRLA